MFDFEKLSVYQKAKKINLDIHKTVLYRKSLAPSIRDQLRRASVSVVINIAEGSGSFTVPSRRNFYRIARGSVFECASLLGILLDLGAISEQDHNNLYDRYEEISKMLYTMIKK